MLESLWDRIGGTDSWLVGVGLGAGYVIGGAYITAKHFVMDKLGEALATGDFYKAITDSINYGYQMSPDLAIVSGVATLLAGKYVLHKIWGEQGSVRSGLFGPVKKDKE